MNLQLLLEMLLRPGRRHIPRDEQAPNQDAFHKNIDPGMWGPLHMEQYPMQPRYRPLLDKLDDLEELERLYRTAPKRGVMPRRTRLGVEEGYRTGDWEWFMKPPDSNKF